MLLVVPLALKHHKLERVGIHRCLSGAHAGVAGRKALRADAAAAEPLFILHHIYPAVLARTPHAIASSVLLLIYFITLDTNWVHDLDGRVLRFP